VKRGTIIPVCCVAQTVARCATAFEGKAQSLSTVRPVEDQAQQHQLRDHLGCPSHAGQEYHSRDGDYLGYGCFAEYLEQARAFREANSNRTFA
jgi:hypothetical protein